MTLPVAAFLGCVEAGNSARCDGAIDGSEPWRIWARGSRLTRRSRDLAIARGNR